METFAATRPDEPGNRLNLITHVEVEPVHKSDANALIPAIESAAAAGLKPKTVVADTLYGSDVNCQEALSRDVDVIAPLMGQPDADRISLADFEFSPKGAITACPQGHAPVKTKTKKTISVAFDSDCCQACPLASSCPVIKGTHHCYLLLSPKQGRIAQRPQQEKTAAFGDMYRWRSGVEATMSEYDRRTGAKKLRVRGFKAVRYCATLKALAINMFRAAAYKLAALMPESGYCAA